MNTFLQMRSGKKLKNICRKKGRPYKNLRATVNGIYWIMKNGSMRRTLPERFGK